MVADPLNSPFWSYQRSFHRATGRCVQCTMSRLVALQSESLDQMSICSKRKDDGWGCRVNDWRPRWRAAEARLSSAASCAPGILFFGGVFCGIHSEQETVDQQWTLLADGGTAPVGQALAGLPEQVIHAMRCIVERCVRI